MIVYSNVYLLSHIVRRRWPRSGSVISNKLYIRFKTALCLCSAPKRKWITEIDQGNHSLKRWRIVRHWYAGLLLLGTSPIYRTRSQDLNLDCTSTGSLVPPPLRVDFSFDSWTWGLRCWKKIRRGKKGKNEENMMMKVEKETNNNQLEQHLSKLSRKCWLGRLRFGVGGFVTLPPLLSFSSILLK